MSELPRRLPNRAFLAWTPLGSAQADPLLVKKLDGEGRGSLASDPLEPFPLYYSHRSRTGGWVEVYPDSARFWRWRHIAGNGQTTIGSLESYRKRSHAVDQALEYCARYVLPLYVLSRKHTKGEDLRRNM